MTKVSVIEKKCIYLSWLSPPLKALAATCSLRVLSSLYIFCRVKIMRIKHKNVRSMKIQNMNLETEITKAKPENAVLELLALVGICAVRVLLLAICILHVKPDIKH